ncbi:MAG: UDP-N-acetylmuramate dehydrogenase [Candidatus Bipolaricaulia bacterium]
MPELEGIIRGTVRYNEDLSVHTSLRVGGRARYFVIPEGIDELREILRFAVARNLPWQIIGNGTNLIFPEVGYSGIIIQLGSGFRGRGLDLERDRLRLGAGENLQSVIHYLNRCYGSSPFDLLVGIPATIGGALIMNAGVPQGTIGDLVSWVRVVDRQGNPICFSKQACGFSYRNSRFKQSHDLIIVEAEFVLSRRDNRLPSARTLLKQRMREQPLDEPSVGCIFKNPNHKLTAGQLIDKAGLKGYKVGRAAVSTKHANFIINEGGARSCDVLRLIEIIQERVYERFGAELEPEVEIVQQDF